MTKSISPPTIILRTELAGYIILGLLLAALLAIDCYFLIQGEFNKPIVLLAFAGFTIFVFVLLLNYFRTTIVIDKYSISFQNLFKQKTIAFLNVYKVETISKIKSVSNHGVDSKMAMMLFSYDDVLEIPIKYFSKKSLTILGKTIVSKCQKAEINRLTILMSEGQMPSLFRTK